MTYKLIGVFSYLAVLLLIGILASRRMRDVRDYFAAGKKLSFWSVAFSARATGESSWLLLGLTGMGAAVGVLSYVNTQFIHNYSLFIQGTVNSIAFSPNERYLAANIGREDVLFWDLQASPAPKKIGPFFDARYRVTSVAFNETSTLLAATDEKGNLLLWDISNPAKVTFMRTVALHTKNITLLRFLPGTNNSLTASLDGDIKIYNHTTNKLVSLVASSTTAWYAGDYFAQTNKLVTADQLRGDLIYRTLPKGPNPTTYNSNYGTNRVRFGPSGNLIAIQTTVPSIVVYTCSCVLTKLLCNTMYCMDPRSNPFHCGKCNKRCLGANAACVSGKCQNCTGPDVVCNGKCVNKFTDKYNCGTCGVMCPATQTCSNGTCACVNGKYTYCSGILKCVDTQTDIMNCGTCGNVCATPGAKVQYCIKGVCQ